MPYRINQILNVMIGAFIGVFIGHGIYKIIDLRCRPGFYAAQSVPWYASILFRGIVAAIAVGVASVFKLYFRNRQK